MPIAEGAGDGVRGRRRPEEVRSGAATSHTLFFFVLLRALGIVSLIISSDRVLHRSSTPVTSVFQHHAGLERDAAAGGAARDLRTPKNAPG